MKKQCLILLGILTLVSQPVFAFGHQMVRDSIKKEPTPFIDQLKEAEHYTIQMNSIGCFHQSSSDLIIAKNKGVYNARLGTKDKVLTSSDIDAIRKFELQLTKMTAGGCTTVDTYTLTYGEQQLTVTDGSCQWRAGWQLQKDLGLVSD